MARLQTQSGGVELDETIRYPVYISLNASTQTIAILNTGPNFISPPEGYESWLASPDDAGLATSDGMTASVGSVTVAAFQGTGLGALPGGPAIVGRPRPRMVMRHFFVSDDEEEKQKPPKPTKARVRRMQLQVLDEAEGLLGTRIPQKFNPPVREAIKDFWDQQATWDDLQRGYAALVAQIVEKAQRDADEDDIESILLTM